ncbi:unnamed protein product, partial [Amoebophrya sp. A25]
FLSLGDPGAAQATVSSSTHDALFISSADANGAGTAALHDSFASNCKEETNVGWLLPEAEMT